MAEIVCKKCESKEHTKSGSIRGHQRYRCKACGCHFTATPPRGKHPAMKALTLLPYGMGTISDRMIAKRLGTSPVSVDEWIRAEAERLPEPEMPADVEWVNIDERWHVLKKRAKRSGSSEPLIRLSGEFFPGCSGVVMMQPSTSFSTKSA